MLSSSPEKLRAMKEKMKKVLGSMRKKSTHSGVIDEDIRWLEVTVSNTLRMQVRHRSAQMGRNLQ